MTNYSRRIGELEKQSADFDHIVVVPKPDEPLPSWAADPHLFVIKRTIVDSPLSASTREGMRQ